MEMRPPREYNKEELKCINSPLLIIASIMNFSYQDKPMKNNLLTKKFFIRNVDQH